LIVFLILGTITTTTPMSTTAKVFVATVGTVSTTSVRIINI